ncbi:hypothetical protein [Solibacillus cecembensis]|uniref:hypothetical protein n=1 Tax=Solibacillus cecembensis TaxID=459347 RepID=UPI003D0597FF
MKIGKTIPPQKKWYKFLLILLSFILTSVVLLVLININSSKLEIESTNKFNNQNLYEITDMLINEREVEFFNDINNYDVLNNFNVNVEKNNNFSFYNVVWQPIAIQNYPDNEQFAAYYDIEGDDELVEVEGEVYRVSNAIQVSKNVFNFNTIELIKGEKFIDSDYQYNSESNIIPIILGYDYLNYFDVNDEIKMNLYGEDFIGKVIGIGSKDASVYSNQDPQLLLNRYIILPSLNFSEQPSEMLAANQVGALYIKALSLTKAGGSLISNQSAVEIRQEISEIANLTGFYDYQIIGANSTSVNLLFKMVNSNQIVINIASGAVMILILFMIVLLINISIKREFESYLVYIINGVTHSTVKAAIIKEFLIFSSVGSIFAILVICMFIKDLSFLSMFIFVACFIVGGLSGLIYYLVNKLVADTNVVEKLKGD